jgi:ABC-type uncharacterized transport system substrate-binding protein
MKTMIITEIVKFKLLDSVAGEILISQADILNDFQQKQDGFIDSELVKNVQENEWSLIYHFESMEKVKAIGEKLRSSSAFSDFTSLIQPGTLALSFYNRLQKWE